MMATAMGIIHISILSFVSKAASLEASSAPWAVSFASWTASFASWAALQALSVAVMSCPAMLTIPVLHYRRLPAAPRPLSERA